MTTTTTTNINNNNSNTTFLNHHIAGVFTAIQPGHSLLSHLAPVAQRLENAIHDIDPLIALFPTISMP